MKTNPPPTDTPQLGRCTAVIGGKTVCKGVTLIPKGEIRVACPTCKKEIRRSGY